MSDVRQMVYRVMSASPDVRIRAARELGLLPEHDGLSGLDLDKAVLLRAIAEDRLAELDARILSDS